MDLYRRDFTVNTLAIQLNPRFFGELIDFFGGVKDIKEKMIRVLHNLSFVEDPTRVFRAIRFEQRFRFQVAKHTQNLMRNAVKVGFWNVFQEDGFFRKSCLSSRKRILFPL
jgi:tRNA nucleotidyltransferase (CCA-adding enzyme)